MNFIIEGNLNFYDELNKTELDDDEDETNTCLLTYMTLDKNHITLPCNHKFNFFPLYREIICQKTPSLKSYLNTEKLQFNEIKCPYCRQKSNKLLPYIKLNDNMMFHQGVNSPEKFCMSFHKCSHIFRSGKNKNSICCKTAYYNGENCYCNKHHILINKKNEKEEQNKLIQKSLCKTILKSGKRKGEECGSNIFINECCKKHTQVNNI